MYCAYVTCGALSRPPQASSQRAVRFSTRRCHGSSLGQSRLSKSSYCTYTQGKQTGGQLQVVMHADTRTSEWGAVKDKEKKRRKRGSRTNKESSC